MATPSWSGCVVLDIDGVLADVRHRLRFVANTPKDWESFFNAAKRDSLLSVGADFARAAATTHTVVYLTGRPERLRADTTSWLQHHNLPAGRLLMRRDGDHRPAVQMKLQELRRLHVELNVELVVDDDPAVINAVQAAGFEARLADWMPLQSRRKASTESRSDDEVLHEAQQLDGGT